jgi:hypothetical protein
VRCVSITPDRCAADPVCVAALTAWLDQPFVEIASERPISEGGQFQAVVDWLIRLKLAGHVFPYSIEK